MYPIEFVSSVVSASNISVYTSRDPSSDILFNGRIKVFGQVGCIFFWSDLIAIKRQVDLPIWGDLFVYHQIYVVNEIVKIKICILYTNTEIRGPLIYKMHPGPEIINFTIANSVAFFKCILLDEIYQFLILLDPASGNQPGQLPVSP